MPEDCPTCKNADTRRSAAKSFVRKRGSKILEQIEDLLTQEVDYFSDTEQMLDSLASEGWVVLIKADGLRPEYVRYEVRASKKGREQISGGAHGTLEEALREFGSAVFRSDVRTNPGVENV